MEEPMAVDDSSPEDTQSSNIDGEQVFLSGRAPTTLSPEQVSVVEYIESTFRIILSEIQKRPFGHPHITLRRITALDAHEDIDSLTTSFDIRHRTVTYGFPGKTKEEAWRFTCLARILSEIHGAILSGTVLTKREIYYRDPDLYKRQQTVDAYIDDIAYTCSVFRACLNVTAAAKGLYATQISGEKSTVNLISSPEDWHKVPEIEGLKFILVVEKEVRVCMHHKVDT